MGHAMVERESEIWRNRNTCSRNRNVANPRSRRGSLEARKGRMNEPVVRVPWPRREAGGSDATLNREWLVTNGLGGYASGTLVGVITRRYHGYLVAALPAPFGRVMMFNDLVERLEFPNGKVYPLGGEER